MAPEVISASTFQGEIPANLQCGFCRRPMQGEFYRAMNRFACANCAAQVNAVVQRNVFAPGPYLAAAGAGLVTAIACAAAWATIVHITNFEIGIVASFIGVAVAKVVLFASGKRRGTTYQLLATGLSIIGILCGKIALISWQISDLLKSNGMAVTPDSIWQGLKIVWQNDPTSVVGGFDLLWMAFAAYAAWRLCKAPRLSVAGPFPLQTTGAPGIQFNTIEPALPSLPPEPQ